MQYIAIAPLLWYLTQNLMVNHTLSIYESPERSVMYKKLDGVDLLVKVIRPSIDCSHISLELNYKDNETEDLDKIKKNAQDLNL